MSTYRGNCYLGIDAGSTTTKVALVGDDGALLYSFYSSNNGNPLATATLAIREIYSLLPEEAHIVHSCSTGYGEALLKSAFLLDEGEVETVAHYYAAAFFNPEVDCILDIGGQDMKCIKIKNQTVDSVQLNEACSSGCDGFTAGYFFKAAQHCVIIEGSALDYNMFPQVFGVGHLDYLKQGILDDRISKAGRDIGYFGAFFLGLLYLGIHKYRAARAQVNGMSGKQSGLGKILHRIIQGFCKSFNKRADAVLRSFEKISGCEAIRPDIAGIMGAFGAALIAKERYEDNPRTTMLPIEEIENLKADTKLTRCQGCANHCLLTINRFTGNRQFITGNRCEKGLGKEKNKEQIPNLFEYKNNCMFSCEPLSQEEALRGSVGIPRVLNMYENYPFWAVFFKTLKFRTMLSPQSTRKIYELGIESIPSESECYPAKLAHGHVSWLIQHQADFIFYPCIPYERDEFPDSNNHFNCPIVTSYAENIKNNVDEITSGKVRFLNPFLSFASKETLAEQLLPLFLQEFSIPPEETQAAVDAGWQELARMREDIRRKGEETLKYMEETGRRGIVLAGRPYHIDPEINHGIPELINSYGIAVLTEDSVSHLKEVERPLLVMDQWMYHSRLYAAANFVKIREDLDLIQLNSFGCGLDAVTTDQVNDILTKSGKIYTCLKIDEVNNLGAARIRIRSLLSALRVKEKQKNCRTVLPSTFDRVVFTEEMRRHYTILCPQMSPIHFELLQPAFQSAGYNMVVLGNQGKSAVDMGLKYVNNDACYPSLMQRMV